MKTRIFAYFTLFSLLANAQVAKVNTIGLSIGGQYFASNSTHKISATPINHVDGSYQHMCNERFGFRLGSAFDQFTFVDGAPKTSQLQFSLQASFNVSEMLDWSKADCPWSLHAHAGFAYAAMWNREMTNGTSLLFQTQKGSIDEMPQLVIGLNPSYALNKQFSVQASVNFNGNFMQDNGFDFSSAPRDGIFSGMYTSATIGMQYHFQCSEKGKK